VLNLICGRWRETRYRLTDEEARERYTAAENQAREAKRGLWADPAPVLPWDWRRK